MEKSNNSTQKKIGTTNLPKSVLEAFEAIVEMAEDSKLTTAFFEKANQYVNYASRKLKLSAMQTVLLAIFVDKSESSRIYLSEIAKHTGCRTTRLLRVSNDIDALENKHYIRASRSINSVSYRVPAEVINAIRANKPYCHTVEAITDTQDFFDRFNSLMEEKDDDEISYEKLRERTQEMLNEIKNTTLVRTLKSHMLDDDDAMLFIFMAHLFVENSDDNIRFSDIEDLYDNDQIPSWQKRNLRNRTSMLFTRKLIENVNEEGMARSDAFKLTEIAKDEVLSELNLTNVGKSDNGLIKHDSLPEKNLIFNSEESSLIEELSSILSNDRFNDVQTRLEKAGMRKGFCCLFYGAPGTGKTETVYQLARQTGRDIMRVDVDKIKSCWVGESEKNIKSLFDRYRSICKNSEVAPILLFNEADAVLGVRMEGASKAVDKMENSIQNIILQEMESLDGIMIATTNLTTNLDKAFERRFLYKIRYDKPSVESREKIWKIMLKRLSATDARTLAANFDLSGGEIENIARRVSVNSILTGNDNINIAEVTQLCQQERITHSSRTKVGF